MDDLSFFAATLIIAAITFITRIAGASLMARFTTSARIERFLEGLSVSVIAALVMSLLVASDFKYGLAVLAALAAMLISRSVIWAMLAGMVVAAILPQILSI